MNPPKTNQPSAAQTLMNFDKKEKEIEEKKETFFGLRTDLYAKKALKVCGSGFGLGLSLCQESSQGNLIGQVFGLSMDLHAKKALEMGAQNNLLLWTFMCV